MRSNNTKVYSIEKWLEEKIHQLNVFCSKVFVQHLLSMQSNTWKVTIAKYKGKFFLNKTMQERVRYLDEFCYKVIV